MEKLLFIIFAVVAIGSALAVVTFRNPVHSAIALMTCLLQVAALFILMRSPFLAVVQVFIYVGAVMVLFLFVVLVLDIKKAIIQTFPAKSRSVVFLIFLVLAIEVELVVLLSPLKGFAVTEAVGESKVESIGKVLFTKYLFPFEVVSVLLLVAMVGAIIMTKRR